MKRFLFYSTVPIKFTLKMNCSVLEKGKLESAYIPETMLAQAIEW